MRLTRVLLALEAIGPREIELPAEQAHYLTRVLRLKADAPLIVADGAGGEYDARLLAGGPRGARLALDGYRRIDRESPLALELVLGVSRGERMDLAVQKAVELGVTDLTPVLTARSVVQLDAARAARRQAHWAGIARSACEQCGRNRLVAVATPVALDEWLAAAPRRGVVLDPDAERALADVAAPAGPFSMLVGPEGGLAPAEVTAAAAAGLQRVHLGPRTLRTETAALAAVCSAQLLWGDLAGGRERDAGA